MPPLIAKFFQRRLRVRPSRLLTIIPVFFFGQFILNSWGTHPMISYNKIKYKTPVSFNEINFEELEKTLKIRIDDFSRESIRQSEHLRRILAYLKSCISNKSVTPTSLDFLEE